NRSGGSLVVNLVVRGEPRNCQSLTGDVRGKCRLRKRIISSTRTTQGQSTHVDRDTISHVRAGESCGVAVRDQRHSVTADHAGERVTVGGNRGRRGLVVNLVVRRQTGD